MMSVTGMIWRGRKHRSIGNPFSWAPAKAMLAACASVAMASLALAPQASAQDASYYRQQAAACRARAAQEQQLARQYASVASESSAHQQAAQANLDAAAAYDRQAASLGSGGGGRSSGSPSRPVSPALARQNTANQMASEMANRLQADPEAQRRLQEERNSDRQSLSDGAQRSGDMATQRLTAALDYDPKDPSQSRVEPVKPASDSPSQASQARPETRSDRSMPPDDSAQRAQLLSAVESLRQDFPTPDPANQTVDFTDSGSVASWGQANSMPNFPFPADTPLVADQPPAGDYPASGGGGNFDAFGSHPAANPGASNPTGGGGYVEPPYEGMADRSSTSTWGSPTSVLDTSSPNRAAAGGPLGPSGGDSRTAFTLDTTAQNSLDDAANPPAEGPRSMSIRERLAGAFNRRALGLADTSQSDDPIERDDDALNRAASPVSLLWRTHGRWLPGVHTYLQDVHSKFNTLFDHATTEIMRDPAARDE